MNIINRTQPSSDRAVKKQSAGGDTRFGYIVVNIPGSRVPGVRAGVAGVVPTAGSDSGRALPASPLLLLLLLLIIIMIIVNEIIIVFVFLMIVICIIITSTVMMDNLSLTPIVYKT